jgi:hypothetical protein
MQPIRPALGPAPAETPTPFAELEIQVGPAQPWGTARGRVPPDQANHLISAFGALGSATAGIAGAVLTLRINAGLTGPAYAELALALVAAALIAFRRLAGRREGGHPDTAGQGRDSARSGPPSAS